MKIKEETHTYIRIYGYDNKPLFLPMFVLVSILLRKFVDSTIPCQLCLIGKEEIIYFLFVVENVIVNNYAHGGELYEILNPLNLIEA